LKEYLLIISISHKMVVGSVIYNYNPYHLEAHVTLSDVLLFIRQIAVIEKLKLTWTLRENNT